MSANAPARGTIAHVILDVATSQESVLQPNVQSLRVYLPGAVGAQGAEVQVAVVDGSLVVIAAGLVVLTDRDSQGFARIRVLPD